MPILTSKMLNRTLSAGTNAVLSDASEIPVFSLSAFMQAYSSIRTRLNGFEQCLACLCSCLRTKTFPLKHDKRPQRINATNTQLALQHCRRSVLPPAGQIQCLFAKFFLRHVFLGKKDLFCQKLIQTMNFDAYFYLDK